MIKGWFERKMAKTRQQDADRFLLGLKGGDHLVIDEVMAVTMYWAKIYEDMGMDLYNVVDWVNSNLEITVHLNTAIRDNQKKGNFSSATGLMVWLHTARAAAFAELRHTGRQIWEELLRSTPDSEHMAVGMLESIGKIGEVNHIRVPDGFEKIVR